MAEMLTRASINPIDWNPLMLVTQDFQRIEHLSEGLIEILVDDHHVQILFVFSLKHRRLFHLVDELIVLKW